MNAMIDDFKRGVELFALGIALQTAAIAFHSFFVARASTLEENIITFLYSGLVGLPIWFYWIEGRLCVR